MLGPLDLFALEYALPLPGADVSVYTVYSLWPVMKRHSVTRALRSESLFIRFSHHRIHADK